MATEPRDIKLSYRTVDRFSETRRFKTLKGARKYAHRRVGAHPDYTWYAVDAYGTGRLTCEGCTMAELFPEPEEAPEDDRWEY